MHVELLVMQTMLVLGLLAGVAIIVHETWMATTGIAIRGGKILTEGGKVNIAPTSGCNDCCNDCPDTCGPNDNCNETYSVTFSGYTGACCSEVNSETFDFEDTGGGDWDGSDFVGDIWVSSSSIVCCTSPTKQGECDEGFSAVIVTNHAACGADQFNSFEYNATASDEGTCCPDGTYQVTHQSGSHQCTSQTGITVVIS